MLTGTAATDLSASRLQFSSAFVSNALAETGSLKSGGVSSGTLVLGNFVTSNGTVTAPSSLVQPKGIVSFKLVSRDGQKAIDLVLERTSLKEFMPSGNVSGFRQIVDSLPILFDELSKVDPRDQRAIQDILKRADAGTTFASVAAATRRRLWLRVHQWTVIWMI